VADTRTTRHKIFDTAHSHGWSHAWDTGYPANTKVNFTRGQETVVVWFSAPGPRDPATDRRPAQRVTGAYATVLPDNRYTSGITGHDKAGQILSRLRAPAAPDLQSVAVTLPMGVWLGVEQALKNQRYELQRWLDRKVEAPEHVRAATQTALAEVTTAIDKIIDTTSAIGD
jgi:hypothetical protein